MPEISTAVDAINTTSFIGERVFTIIFSLLIAIGGTALWIRRKLSKDTLEINKDDAERELLKHLTEERDILKQDKERILNNLLSIDKDRQEARAAVSALTVEIEHLSKQVISLEKIIETLSEELKIATTNMHNLAIENAKLNEKIEVFKELAELKCAHCIHSKIIDKEN